MLIFQCAKQVVDILLLIERVIAAKAMFGSYQLLVLIKLILFEALGLSKFPLFVSSHSDRDGFVMSVYKQIIHRQRIFADSSFMPSGQGIENNTTELLR